MHRWPLFLLVFAVSCRSGGQPARDAAFDRSEDRVSTATMDQAAADVNRADSPHRASLDQAGGEVRLDLRPDTGLADRPPAQTSCEGHPNTAEACAQSTCVQGHCDVSRPSGIVAAPASGPLLAEIRVLRGPCFANPCQNGCSSLRIFLKDSFYEPDGGVFCDFEAISIDGRSEAGSLAVVRRTSSEGSGICCGRGDGTGYWVSSEVYWSFEPYSVELRFAADAGADDASDASAGRDSKADGIDGEG